MPEVSNIPFIIGLNSAAKFFPAKEMVADADADADADVDEGCPLSVWQDKRPVLQLANFCGRISTSLAFLAIYFLLLFFFFFLVYLCVGVCQCVCLYFMWHTLVALVVVVPAACLMSWLLAAMSCLATRRQEMYLPFFMYLYRLFFFFFFTESCLVHEICMTR